MTALTGVVVVLVAHNVLIERLPSWAYVPAGLATTTGVVAIAASGGVGPSELGLSPSALPHGLLVGAGLGVVVALAVAGVAVVPATQVLFGDRRIAGVGPVGTAYRAIVRIPLGTVVLEEVAFRGVLVALGTQVASVDWAVAGASVAFGLWHVVPTAAALDLNRVAMSARSRALALAAVVALTAAIGAGLCALRLATDSLAAPALVHASATTTATVAAFVVLRKAASTPQGLCRAGGGP